MMMWLVVHKVFLRCGECMLGKIRIGQVSERGGYGKYSVSADNLFLSKGEPSSQGI